ncbi:hypothetical protein SLA2020_393810 [Shorea laevis]
MQSIVDSHFHHHAKFSCLDSSHMLTSLLVFGDFFPVFSWICISNLATVWIYEQEKNFFRDILELYLNINPNYVNIYQGVFPQSFYLLDAKDSDPLCSVLGHRRRIFGPFEYKGRKLRWSLG